MSSETGTPNNTSRHTREGERQRKISMGTSCANLACPLKQAHRTTHPDTPEKVRDKGKSVWALPVPMRHVLLNRNTEQHIQTHQRRHTREGERLRKISMGTSCANLACPLKQAHRTTHPDTPEKVRDKGKSVWALPVPMRHVLLNRNTEQHIQTHQRR
ncbi:hypothetical protein J6590_097372 [Homalodisca vitripennis]|nr:hypothetical protein J6590_097372 [Homalodisca vitripennis]